MFNFPDKGQAPGVYVVEVDRPGPIAGVGTSTAAIIGPALDGPIGIPTRITNPTQFESTFGGGVPGGYIAAPTVYATHAVHGFFANGGAQLYYVRVGTAARSSLELDDRDGAVTVVVTAKEEGVAGDGITVEVQDANLASTTAATNSANLAGAGAVGASVELDDASGFRPGDAVSVTVGANPPDRRTVTSIAGNTLTLDSSVSNNGAAGTARVADLIPGQTKIRVASTTNLFAGSYVVLDQAATATSQPAVVSGVEPANGFLTLSQALTSTFDLTAGAVTVVSQEFNLVVSHPQSGAEPPFANLAMDPRHPNYYRSTVDSAHVTVAAADDPPNPTAPPDNLPAAIAATPLAGGADDDVPAALADTNRFLDAITALQKVDDVNILLIPDRTDQTVQQALVDHCQTDTQDRFAVLDAQRNSDSAGIEAQRDALSSNRGYAALYYPWIVVNNPLAEGTLLVPPSGHVAGLYARVDTARGVHKAPANETLSSLIGLERVLTDDEQAPLNDKGINVIRSFVGRGIRVWGARTIAPDSQTQWRYVNVRRLMLFIEESIQEGTQGAVFEPNNQALWETLKRQVSGFLTRVWQSGALVGQTPDEAFRVRIDEELNPPEVRALGQLRIEVRVAPTTPAEFVVFFITHQPGETIVDE